MKVVVAGATGVIGRPLVAELVRCGHTVVVLSRRAEAEVPGAQVVAWQPPHGGPWERELVGADAVVNLAGAPVAAAPWTAAEKARILGSRVEATRAIVTALGRADPRPATLVNASAIGYYGDRGAERLTEVSAPGSGFLARVCVAWEAEARRAEALGVRVVLARTGVVLAREGGALPALVLPFRFFLGGPLGDPGLWLAWIHLADEVGMLTWALDEARLSGPVNLVAPHPVRLDEFTAAIGRVLGRPSWLPVPAFALRTILGERYEALFASLRVYPAVAERLGYSFRFPDLEPALRDLLGPAGSRVG